MAIVIASLAAIHFVFAYSGDQVCKQYAFPGAKDCGRLDDALTFLRQVGEALNYWAPAIAALAATAVACFTLTLKWSTDRLWAEAGRQREDARKSALSGVITARTALRSAQAAERELRAWVSIAVELYECKRAKDYALVTVRVTAENVGKTPALRVGVSVVCRVVPTIVANYGELPAPQAIPHPLPSLPPGSSADQRIGETISLRDIEAGLAAARQVNFAPMIVVDVIVYYHTVFDAEGATKRMTSVRYTMHPRIAAEEWHNEARMRWLNEDGPAAVDQVNFGQDKSAPVYLS